MRKNIQILSLNEFFLLLIYKFALEVAYISFVHPLYDYSGFTLDLDHLKLFESYLFLVLLFFLLPHKENRISGVTLQLLFMLMIVPTLSLYALINGPRVYMYFFVVGFCVAVLTVQIFPRLKVKKVKSRNHLFFLFLGMVSILVCVVLLKLNGMPSLKALSFLTVYEIRSELNRGPQIMGYLIPWVANVIVCFFIGFTWYKRKFFALFFPLGLSLFLFLITGHKVFFFCPILLLFLLYFISRKRLLQLSLMSLVGIILFSLILHKLNVTDLPASLFIRRALFVPARVSFSYYDFFSNNQLTYLSQSKMSFGLIENPYASPNMSIANMMGSIYAGNPMTSMNTGIMGDAYMNFGLAGVLIFSFLLGLFLNLADSISRKCNIYVAIGAIIIPLLKLLNGAFFTVMLTGGLLFALFVIWLYCNVADKFSWKKCEGGSSFCFPNGER